MNFLSKIFIVFCLFGRASCMDILVEDDFLPNQDMIDKYKKILINPVSKNYDDSSNPGTILFMNHPQYRAVESFDFSEKDLPASIDFRNSSLCPPIYEQGQLGSCTANSGASAVWYLLLQKDPNIAFDPSRLFLYYNERKMQETICHSSSPITDSGAWEFTIILGLHKYGICPDTMWPYDIDMCNQEPPENCYAAALSAVDSSTVVHSLVPRDLTKIKAVLAQKIPIVIGLAIYGSSVTPYAWRTGIISTPTDILNNILVGEHSVMLIGYNDNMVGLDGNQGYFIFQNSWGEKFGDKGYGYLPYDYVMNTDLAFARFFITDIINDVK